MDLDTFFPDVDRRPGASWFIALDVGPDEPRYREIDAASGEVLRELGTCFAQAAETLARS